MPGTFEKGITIRQAIRHIDNRTFLLPAIQRNFVWSTQQICTLFDSMMRDYPINTFMFWDVKSPDIKNQYRFYGFLTHYCQRFKESNDHVPTQGDFHDFKAVIDGQQRLTSIYIGLKGTYAYKQPRVWWPNTKNDDVLPPRGLYLNLVQGVDCEDNESLAQYDFRFLTDKQYAAQQNDIGAHWYKVGAVLMLPEVKSVDEISFDVVWPYLKQHGLVENAFARKALTRLYFLVRHEEVIRYYNEESQEIDHVLDVFIRTNSGGTPLAFADLLMSIAIANWDGDAREVIDSLVTEVRQSSEMQFSIGRDWVLKACLMVTGSDVRFKVKNFDANKVNVIQNQWQQIRACVVATFKLLRLLGLKDHNLRAKNAVIPLVYYLYKQTHLGQPLYLSINNPNLLRDERMALSRWLNMALLKGVFGGQGDGILSKMQGLINEHLTDGAFPIDKIIEAFNLSTKDLRFDETYLRGLLDIQYEDSRCRSVLSLLFPEINENLLLDIDHLHPKSAFTENKLAQQAFLNAEPVKISYYKNPNNWNSLANLHLLNASQNRAKKDRALDDWMVEVGIGIKPRDLLLDDQVSLDFEDFQQFCEARREALLQRLRRNVVVTAALPVSDEVFDEGEESDINT